MAKPDEPQPYHVYAGTGTQAQTGVYQQPMRSSMDYAYPRMRSAPSYQPIGMSGFGGQASQRPMVQAEDGSWVPASFYDQPATYPAMSGPPQGASLLQLFLAYLQNQGMWR